MLGEGDELQQAYDAAKIQADTAVGALDKLFLATPYRPTGLSTRARAEIRLVDELRWLSTVILHSGMRTRPANPNHSIGALKLAAADVLECAATALAATPASSPHAADELTAARARLRDALEDLERQTTARPLEQQPLSGNGGAAAVVVTALNPGFRAQEVAYITEQIASNARFRRCRSTPHLVAAAAGAAAVRLYGTVASAWERALGACVAELVMAAQQPPRRHRPGARGARCRVDLRGARLLGGLGSTRRCCAPTRSALDRTCSAGCWGRRPDSSSAA